ncbi:hypothetical protein KCU67_g51, partial [Aureobasidium melanogenum]
MDKSNRYSLVYPSMDKLDWIWTSIHEHLCLWTSVRYAIRVAITASITFPSVASRDIGRGTIFATFHCIGLAILLSALQCIILCLLWPLKDRRFWEETV